MFSQTLSRIKTCAIVACTLMVAMHVVAIVNGAQSTPTKPRLPQRKKATLKPFAPPVVPETAAQKTSPNRISKAAVNTAVTKEAQKQATQPTRNLIMLFDSGENLSAVHNTLASGLVQQSAFIICTQQLWEGFKTMQARTMFTDTREETNEQELMLQKILGDQTCADVFFNPSAWDVYTADGKEADKQDRFYIFVPHHYLRVGLGNAQKDKDLGLNISRLTPVKDPLQTTPTTNAAKNNYAKGSVATSALQKILCSETTHPWSIYCTGHGFRGGRETGSIAGLSIPAFENLMQFFNKPLTQPTNFFVYSTCFGGGEHLTIPFVTKGAVTTLSYPIATVSLTDAPTTSQAFLSTQDEKTISLKTPMPTLSTKANCPVYFYSGTNFETFFNGLTAFANGASKNNDLMVTLNAVSGFLTPDLQMVKHLENLPQIRFPGTEWFQVSRLGTIPSIHLTRVNVMAYHYNAMQSKTASNMDATDKFLFLQTPNIAVPLTIDSTTVIVPLINTLHFLQKKPLIINTQKMPNLFAFTAPLTTTDGFFKFLDSLVTSLAESKFSNIAFLANSFTCANDLDAEQQQLIAAAPTLQLEQVMITLGAPNFLNPDLTNTAIFVCNGKYFFVDMRNNNQCSQLDEKKAAQYQGVYKQCIAHCLDESIEQLHKKARRSLE